MEKNKFVVKIEIITSATIITLKKAVFNTTINLLTHYGL